MALGQSRDLLITAAIIIAGAICIAVLTGRLETLHPRLPPSYADSDLTFHASKLKGFALGSEGLIADWYYIRSLEYIGDKVMNAQDDVVNVEDLRKLDPRLLYPMLENATDLDPHFIAAYTFGAVILPAIDPNKAIELTEKGIRNNPDSWRLYQYLGYIYWKIGKYDKASETYNKGASVPGAPSFMALMAAAMNDAGGSRETARSIYTAMLQSSDDDQVKLTASRRLAEFDLLDQQDAINMALADARQRTGRCPSSLSEILPVLERTELPAKGHFSVDGENNLVDASGTPFEIDQSKCDVRSKVTARVSR